MRRLSVLLLSLVVLTSCRVDANVHVTMRDDGSGTIDVSITLDGDAVSRVEQNGRTLDTAFRLDDLDDAAWEIGPWTRDADGGATLKLSHDFTGEEQLGARLADLGGTSKPLGGVRVIHERAFLRARDELSIDADLRGLASGIADDPELVAALTAAGLDPATLEQQLTSELQNSFRLTVGVELTNGQVDETQIGAGEHRRVTAAHKTFHSSRVVALAAAGLLVFLAVLLYLSASISARRDRARRRVVTTRAEPDRTPLM